VRCSANFPESFQKALEILSKRWTGLVLFVLGQGPLRFNEIAAQIDVISDRMLSERLKELEVEGIVERRIFAEVPVRVEYRLTEKGVALVPIYEAIGGWAARWIDGVEEPAACDAHASPAQASASAASAWPRSGHRST
jgi:DNA-binding HxlR family transcriptional regulator